MKMTLGPESISPICENAGPRTKTIWPRMALFSDGKQGRFWPNGFRAGRKPQTYRQYSMQTRAFQIALIKGFPNMPHIPAPPLQDTQWVEIRQQWHRSLKTLRVGIVLHDPERYPETATTC